MGLIHELDMNIYLDIDGVLLANDRQPAKYAKEFLQKVLKEYPENTYWLTTHCMTGDATEPIRNVGKYFDKETILLFAMIKPTSWKKAKTEAIDLLQPFLWFDDDLYPDEETVLREHGLTDNWIGVDLAKNESQLLDFIRSFPLAKQ